MFSSHHTNTIHLQTEKTTLNCDTLLPTTLANLFDIQNIHSSSTASIIIYMHFYRNGF